MEGWLESRLWEGCEGEEEAAQLGRSGICAVHQYQLVSKVRTGGRLQSQFPGQGVGHLG